MFSLGPGVHFLLLIHAEPKFRVESKIARGRRKKSSTIGFIASKSIA
jgi:hypothetical protein